MKKKKFTLFLFLIGILMIVIASYVGMARFYQNRFAYGTTINRIYSAGLTVKELNQALVCIQSDKTLDITCIDGQTVHIPLEQLEMQIDYTKELSELMQKQNPYLWGIRLKLQQTFTVKPEITFDEKKVSAVLKKYEFMNENLYQENGDYKVEIVDTDDKGYVLEDHTKDLLDADMAKTMIFETLKEGDTRISLKASNCYKSLPETKEMLQVKKEYEKVNAFQSFSVTYKFGNLEEVIDPSVTSEWIMVDEDGNFVYDENGDLILDEKMLKEYVAYLATKYDTLGKTRQFQATRGDIITIEGGTYGNQLDTETEYNWLLEAFQNKKTGGTRTPVYLSQAIYQGEDDIGNTYIEVDMTEQKMYYYLNGGIVFQSDIVTGNLARHYDTPARVCYVYYKQEHRVLRGANYATPVNYWMAVNGHIGIHDATWRKEFGGEIYKTNGSHGCINTPLENMKRLYGMVEIGTPVIMFY